MKWVGRVVIYLIGRYWERRSANAMRRWRLSLRSERSRDLARAQLYHDRATKFLSRSGVR